MRWFGAAFGAAFGSCVSGCTYITQAQFEDKRNTVDEDGDGAPFSSDCDDLNASVSPTLPEVPYDGIDNDCGKDGDVVDADGDGYPGISADAYAALDPLQPFPTELVGKPVDCADDPAVFPEAAAIFPDSAAEVPYDGLDSDCDLANDFDTDGDGYMPATVRVGADTVDVAAAFDAYVAAWGYEDRLPVWAPLGSAEPVIGDCNDFDAEVHPNPVLPEVWYDGVDQDCDGTNDFDRDGDGWMPPALPDGSDPRTAYDLFVQAYHDDNPPWTLPADVVLSDGTVLDAFSDCLDVEDPAIVPNGGAGPADPALVYPRDTTDDDAWYDGVDTNCWHDDDFDRDLDGFVPDTVDIGGNDVPIAPLYDAYVALWHYEDYEASWSSDGTTVPGTGDCKDTDPATYPEALELIGDGADQDCDGNADAAAFATAGWVWDRASAPRITRIGDSYVIAATAGRIDQGGGTILEDVGAALVIPLAEARSGAVPVLPLPQFKNADTTRPVDGTIDVENVPVPTDLSMDGIPDPAAWFGTTYTADQNGYTYLHGRMLYEHSGSGAVVLGDLVANFTTTSYAPTSFELTVNDDGEPYLFGCTDDRLHVIQGLAPQPTFPELEDETADQGGLCFLQGSPTPAGANEVVSFTRCTATRCAEFPLTLSADLALGAGTTTGESWDTGQLHGDLQILLDGGDLTVRDPGAGDDFPLFGGDNVLAADAMRIGQVLFAAALVDRVAGPEVQVVYGVFPAMAGPIVMPFVVPPPLDVEPFGVALHVDQDRLVVAVSARDASGQPDGDVVGWTFLGTP